MGGTTRDRREFDDPVKDEAARFLDRDLTERGASHTDKTLKRCVISRINGIGYVEVAEKWIRVEVELDRGPRQLILATLNQRKSWLEEHGDRDERIPYGPREPCDCCEPGDSAEAVAELRAARAKERELINYEPNPAVTGEDDGAEPSTLDSFAVATDGGDTDDAE
jgi:hypothetical protein